ncbi:hypothetical protein [Alloprevotella tannerae]|jgi:hypothetical protein|uniref:hypothetical protein n=1 Tax=Alloprevotella tannerae TaxID=76122 RepID=UPI0028E1A9DD|nr:hypothetical protein [Alloprevotella tannerae]
MTMIKRLTVVPQGGLCNRLRVALSALSAFPDCEVEWGRDKACYAYFDELFQPLKGVIRRRWWNTPQTRRNLHFPALLRRWIYDAQLVNAKALPAVIDRPTYVSTGYALGSYGREWLQRLKPLDSIRRRIDAITAQFPPDIVGVHIRRTDNKKSWSHSSDEAFWRAMEATGGTFYLATDDLDLRQALCRYFNVITQPLSSVRRDTREGIEEAVVDLYCLAATNRLFGSYWSSFSDTAAELGNIPLSIIQ